MSGPDTQTPVGASVFLSLSGLDDLIRSLKQSGYEVVGPTLRQGAICYDRIHAVQDLPRGWTDRQEPGHYRLERREDDACFGYVVGPQSWKQFLFPPMSTVSLAELSTDGWRVTANDGANEPRFAFLGVRACELAAIAIQDRVFQQAAYTDPIYAARRERALLIAVNCTQAAPTCFCESMHTGPRCSSGFDLALTELDDGFIVEVGSQRGATLIATVATVGVTDEQLQWAEERRSGARKQQRQMPRETARDTVLGNLQHPRWSEVAERCLSCTNCTQVCPTCFCSSVHEVTDLDMTRVERERVWDSCFNLEFSYMNGGAVRNSIRSRYRQWLTHKLGSWHEQFGTSGCVGCGRCITWCPVGIDLTEEVVALAGGST